MKYIKPQSQILIFTASDVVSTSVDTTGGGYTDNEASSTIG